VRSQQLIRLIRLLHKIASFLQTGCIRNRTSVDARKRWRPLQCEQTNSFFHSRFTSESTLRRLLALRHALRKLIVVNLNPNNVIIFLEASTKASPYTITNENTFSIQMRCRRSMLAQSNKCLQNKSLDKTSNPDQIISGILHSIDDSHVSKTDSVEHERKETFARFLPNHWRVLAFVRILKRIFAFSRLPNADSSVVSGSTYRVSVRRKMRSTTQLARIQRNITRNKSSSTPYHNKNGFLVQTSLSSTTRAPYVHNPITATRN
jgi:hypothetical protein